MYLSVFVCLQETSCTSRISVAGTYDRLTSNTAAITTGQNSYNWTMFSTKLISKLLIKS